MSDWNSCTNSSAGPNRFLCPKCNHISTTHLRNDLVIFVCPQCMNTFSRDKFEAYSKLHRQNHLNASALELGDKGEFEGKTYTVIGIAQKEELHKLYSRWEEYVLLDNMGEISFLNLSYGHFTWMHRTLDIPIDAVLSDLKSDFEYKGQQYSFFARYNYETIKCKGEFPYDVIDVKKVKCVDFISPPHIISLERVGKETPDAFFGTHFNRKQIARIFDKPGIRYIEKEGIGMAQPVLNNINLTVLNRVVAVFSVLLILYTIFSGTQANRRQFYTSEFLINPNESPEFVSPSFYIDSTSTNNYLGFTGQSSLTNEWIETGLTLVNESTGEEREFGVVMEYYSGVDNGYSWSEGEDNHTDYVSSIPGGKYHLKIKFYSSITESRIVRLSGKYAGTTNWNLGITLLPLIIITIALNLLKSHYENVRRGE